MERRGDVELFLITGIISGIIFFIGLFVGFAVGGQKISILEDSIGNLQQNIQEINMQFNILDIMNETASCEFMVSIADQLGTEASDLGKKLEQMEVEGKMMTEDYMKLKKDYMLVLINDWISIEEIKRRCDTNMTTVLYFYSNINCQTCQEQASVLNFYKTVMNNDIMIFSLDADTNMTVINSLVSTYEVSSYPSLLINGKIKVGYTSRDELENYLCEFSKYSFC
jgi:thiol-disulfide isomerase/thioredoxin